jgi:hypothetical protein
LNMNKLLFYLFGEVRRVMRFGIGLALGMAVPMTMQAEPLQNRVQRLFVDLSGMPDATNLLAFDCCVLDAEAEVELGPGRALGHQYYARLAGVALPEGSALAAEAALGGITLKSPAAKGGGFLLDPLHPQWMDWVIERQAKAAAQRGFGGFFVQGAEELEQVNALRPGKAAEHRLAFVRMVQALHERFPDKPILLHRGEELVPALQRSLYGVVMDGVFRRVGEGGRTTEWNAEAAAGVERTIRQIQSCGLKVMAVEFGDPARPNLNRAMAERLQALGCVAFVTTPELDGTVLGPELPVARQVLVLHGWDPEQTQVAQRAAEQTWTAQSVKPALSWLGLEPKFVTVPEWLRAQATAGQLMHPMPAAIMIDPETELEPEVQRALVEWLMVAVENEIPLLLTGQPFTDEASWQALAERLGLQGSGKEQPSVERARLARYAADVMLAGQLPEQQAVRSLDLRAPAGTQTLLSFRPVKEGGEGFDACFIAPWGGVWLARTMQAPLDAYRFLEVALQRQQSAPVVDTSTLAGQQIYVSTVQGRGFVESSWLPGGPLCGQVLVDELAQFPSLPVTVAVAEADLRGWSTAAQPSEAMRYEAIARALFALPQVEPATNSYSRPMDWNPERFQVGALRPVVPDSRAGLEREIAGPMAYLHRRLIPPGKNPLFMLWPEGPAPSQAAIDQLLAVGGKYLAGSWESGWNLSPPEQARGRGNAAVGASSAELTPPNQPAAIAQAWFDQHRPDPQARRMGPIHLAYAFEDLKQPATVEALRQIWAWCAEQPLHPLTASSYAELMAAAEAVTIYPVKAQHWRVISGGGSITLRLPAQRGLPDMARSTGVIGYSQQGDQLYLQLNGQVVSEIVLQPAEETERHLHLVAADRLVDFHQLTVDSARFRLQGRDDAIVTLGGLEPGSQYFITASAQQARQRADASGRVTFRAPALATISIQPDSIQPYAAR